MYKYKCSKCTVSMCLLFNAGEKKKPQTVRKLFSIKIWKQRAQSTWNARLYSQLPFSFFAVGGFCTLRLTSFVTLQLLDSLVSMRQACCHPQAALGRYAVSAITTGGSGGNTVLSMEELLEQMIGSVRTKCTDYQRRIIAALNGQAAIHAIQNRVSPQYGIYYTTS